jgi:hypothetical protein
MKAIFYSSLFIVIAFIAILVVNYWVNLATGNYEPNRIGIGFASIFSGVLFIPMFLGIVKGLKIRNEHCYLCSPLPPANRLTIRTLCVL